MSTWIRGGRCGIDNCKSQLWKVVDGRKICQFGHVKEGDLEIGDDEDEFYGSQAGTRVSRINLNGSQTTDILLNASQKKDDELSVLYGKDGLALLMQTLQFILRKQIQWLRGNQGLGDEFEAICKSIWAVFVNSTKFSKIEFGKKRKRRSSTRGISPETTESEFSELSEFESEYSGTESRENFNLGHQRISLDTKVQLLDTVAVCYLACVLLRVPIYIYDIQRWICQYEFPFMNLTGLLPSDMMRGLSATYVAMITPTALPNTGQLHESSINLAQLLKSQNIMLPVLNYKPLLFKIVRDLFLPPEVLAASILFIQKTQPKGLGFQNFVENGSINHPKYSFPEVMCLVSVILCTKLYLGLDGDPVNNQIAYDEELYSDILRKTWLEDDCFGFAEEREVVYWDHDQVQRYLDWFEKNIMKAGETDKMSVSRGRLLKMFPMGIWDSKARLSERPSVDPLHPTNTTADEIYREIQSRTVLSDGGSRELGEGYASFNQHATIPDLLEIVQKSALKLAGIKEEVLAIALRKSEKKLVKSSEH